MRRRIERADAVVCISRAVASQFIGPTDAVAGSDTIALLAGDPFPGNEWAERELAGTDDVRLLGFRDDIDNVLGAADVVVVPSTRPEPLGLVALEAAAAGLPVVAAAHGGLPEIIRDGETGRLVPPGDRAALAAALRRLEEDPSLGPRLGEAAARDVSERFSQQRMLRELQDLYEGLLSRG